MVKTQMVLPVRELLHKEGTKREDVITFILCVDEITQGACWTDKEWVLTMANLLGGRAAPLARWIRTGLSVGQPIDQEVVAFKKPMAMARLCMEPMRSCNNAINEETRRSLSSRSVWRNSFGPWRMSQVNWQRQQNS